MSVVVSVGLAIALFAFFASAIVGLFYIGRFTLRQWFSTWAFAGAVTTAVLWGFAGLVCALVRLLPL